MWQLDRGEKFMLRQLKHESQKHKITNNTSEYFFPVVCGVVQSIIKL